METEYSLRSRAGTTSLTSLTVISTVAVALNALGLPGSSYNIITVEVHNMVYRLYNIAQTIEGRNVIVKLTIVLE